MFLHCLLVACCCGYLAVDLEGSWIFWLIIDVVVVGC